MRTLRTIGPKVGTIDTRRVRVPEKRADPELLTPEHRAWRRQVLERAGHRCEWNEGGLRCQKAAPQHRLFADHIRERSDGGAALDPRNGQCLCGQHHSLKTARARAARQRG